MQKKELSLVHEIKAPENPTEKPPLLIMLHGYGSNEQDLYSMADMLNKNFLIISVRAPLTLPWGGFAWYEIDFNNLGEKMNNIDQAKESLKSLQIFIEEAKKAYGTAPDETWLMGFSQGCILSYALALNEPENYRGILALSGYILKDIVPESYNSSKKIGQLDFFISHGTQDEVLPVEWARQSVKALEQIGVPHQYREYPMGHGINPQCFEDIKSWLKSRGKL